MAVQSVPASPVGWVDATENKLQPCTDLNWCLQFDKDETLRFQVKATKLGSDLSEGLRLLPEESGTTTSNSANELKDNTQNFLSDDIQAGDLVVNTDTGQQTSTSGVPSANDTIPLTDDIFTASPEAYEILRIAVPAAGVVTYDWTNNELDASANASFQINFRDLIPALSTRYAVEVDFANFTSGSVLARFGGALETVAKSPRATGNGTWTFYGGEDNATGNDFILEDDSLNASWTITGIRIYIVSVVSVDLVDDTGTAVDTFVETDHIHDRAIVEADYSARKAGCYTLELFDDTLDELMENGTFDSNSDFAWDFNNRGVGWRVNSNSLDHVGGGDPGDDDATGTLKQTTRPECEYTFSYAQTSTGAVDAKLILADGTEMTVLSTSTIATHSYVFSGLEVVSVQFTADDTATPQIDNVRIQGSSVCPVLTSEKICLSADPPNACKIQRTIDGAASEVRESLGMWVDTTDYVETVWHCVNVRHARYDDPDWEGYRDSAGTHSVVFSDSVEIQDLQIDLAPRYFHDWMRAALRSDTFTIEDVEWYPVTPEYAPNWDRRAKIAGAVVEIAKQGQDIKATLC